jgi:hypothetical protein
MKFYKRKGKGKHEIKKMIPNRQNVPPSARVLTAIICLPPYNDSVILLRESGEGFWVYIQEINDIEGLTVAPMDGRKS